MAESIKHKKLQAMTYVSGAILTFLLIACGSTNIKKIGNGGLIAFSLESNGLGAKGKGGILTLKNTQTGDTISTKALSPFSAHCIAANVPPGTYTVSKIQVPVGTYMYSNWSEEVGKFFGEILVESNMKIYLGQFKGDRAVGVNKVLKIERVEAKMPSDLRDKIETPESGWQNGDISLKAPAQSTALIVY